MRRIARGFIAFFDHAAAGGIVLLLAAALALILDNSPLSSIYDQLLSTHLTIKLGDLGLDKPLLLWINDGLMAIFFFLAGLEIKRELLVGKLSSVQAASLPAIAAFGGMVVPAAIYAFFTMGDAEALKGWAIPAATDIAFALGVLALLGKRVPEALKIFLLALAILDDLGAIIVIALFYTADLSVWSLMAAGGGILILIALNRFGVRQLSPYVIVGIAIWVLVLKSGVHATLAGVAVALTIPLDSDEEEDSPLERAEHALHPWIAFGVMPIFAFANAGVSLSGLSFSDLLSPIPLGVAAGLFFGKQIGVFGFMALAIFLGIARRPEGVRWVELYGASILAGIGFTMSLFIGMLAFSDPQNAAAVRLGVLAGSIASALIGYALLRFALSARSAPPKEAIAGH
ncbi:MAG: Na+/H+ antiporter NhaA [Hyphomicrobiales bacterium]